MKNYYDILGVSEDASNEQIKKAFKDIAKKEHPDRGGNEAKFKEANEAYDTLKNSQKRHDYDTMRKFGSTQGGGQHPFFNEDIFGDFFSNFGIKYLMTKITRKKHKNIFVLGFRVHMYHYLWVILRKYVQCKQKKEDWKSFQFQKLQRERQILKIVTYRTRAIMGA